MYMTWQRCRHKKLCKSTQKSPKTGKKTDKRKKVAFSHNKNLFAWKSIYIFVASKVIRK